MRLLFRQAPTPLKVYGERKTSPGFFFQAHTVNKRVPKTDAEYDEGFYKLHLRAGFQPSTMRAVVRLDDLWNLDVRYPISIEGLQFLDLKDSIKMVNEALVPEEGEEIPDSEIANRIAKIGKAAFAYRQGTVTGLYLKRVESIIQPTFSKERRLIYSHPGIDPQTQQTNKDATDEWPLQDFWDSLRYYQDKNQFNSLNFDHPILQVEFADIRYWLNEYGGVGWRPYNQSVGYLYRVPVGLRNLVEETPHRDTSNVPVETYENQHAETPSPPFSEAQQDLIADNRQKARLHGGILEPTEQVNQRPLVPPYTKTDEGRRPLTWKETLWSLCIESGLAYDARGRDADPEVTLSEGDYRSFIDIRNFQAPPLPSYPTLPAEGSAWSKLCRLVEETGHVIQPTRTGLLRVVPIVSQSPRELDPPDGTGEHAVGLYWGNLVYYWAMLPGGITGLVSSPGVYNTYHKRLPEYYAVRHRTGQGFESFAMAGPEEPDSRGGIAQTIIPTNKLLAGVDINLFYYDTRIGSNLGLMKTLLDHNNGTNAPTGDDALGSRINRDLTMPGKVLDCCTLEWSGYVLPTSGYWMGDANLKSWHPFNGVLDDFTREAYASIFNNESVWPQVINWKYESADPTQDLLYSDPNYRPGDFFAPSTYLLSLTPSVEGRTPKLPPYLFPLGKMAQVDLLRELIPSDRPFIFSELISVSPTWYFKEVCWDLLKRSTTIHQGLPDPAPPLTTLSSQRSSGGKVIVAQLLDTVPKGGYGFYPVRFIHLSKTQPKSEQLSAEAAEWVDSGSPPEGYQTYPDVPEVPVVQAPGSSGTYINDATYPDGTNAENRKWFADKRGLESRPDTPYTYEAAPNPGDIDGDNLPKDSGTPTNDRTFYRVENGLLCLANLSGRIARRGEIHRLFLGTNGAYTLPPTESSVLALVEVAEDVLATDKVFDGVLIDEYRPNRLHASDPTLSGSAVAYLEDLAAEQTPEEGSQLPLERVRVVNAQSEALTKGDRKLVALAGLGEPWPAEGDDLTIPLADLGDMLDGPTVWRTVPGGTGGSAPPTGGSERVCGNVLAKVKNCSENTIYPGQWIAYTRPTGSRYERTRPYDWYFDRTADRTALPGTPSYGGAPETIEDSTDDPAENIIPYDPTAAPPETNWRHPVESGNNFTPLEPEEGLGPLELHKQNDPPTSQSCPTLIGKEYPAEVPIYLELTDERINDAWARLGRFMQWAPAVAIEEIAPGETGDCVVKGLVEAWGDLRHLTDNYLAPRQGGLQRVVAVAGEPEDQIVGYLSHYDEGPGYKPLDANGESLGPEPAVTIDSKTEYPSRYYSPRGNLLYSSSKGPVRILEASRRDLTEDQPYIAFTQVEFIGSITRRVDTEQDGFLLVPGGQAGNVLVMTVIGEEEDTGGSAQNSVDTAFTIANGWKLILDENTKVTGGDKDFWLHRCVFVRGLPTRRDDPVVAYFLPKTVNTLNRFADLHEYRGADANQVVAVDQTKGYASPDVGARLNQPGRVYTLQQMTHVREEPAS